jgi:hypothetical protein
VRPLVRCINLLKCPQLAQLLGSFLHGVTNTRPTPSRSFEPFPFLTVAKTSRAATHMARQALEPKRRAAGSDGRHPLQPSRFKLSHCLSEPLQLAAAAAWQC